MAQTKIQSKQIEDSLSGKTVSVEDWTSPSLQNSWEDYGGSFDDSGYMKDSQGVVHLKGLIRYGEIPGNIFVLPKGYRPLYPIIFETVCSGTGNVSVIYVYANGTVYALRGNSGGWLSLNGISFKAEQ